MPAQADLTHLALRTLEDALAEAEHGPVRRRWGHRLVLAWLVKAGIAERWHGRGRWLGWTGMTGFGLANGAVNDANGALSYRTANGWFGRKPT